MSNEEELLAKVKICLESSSGVSAACIESVKAEAERMVVRRRRWQWCQKGAGLIAASLVMAVVWQFHVREKGSADRELVSAIELLCAVDGRQVEGANAAELLLAWQDAPYYGIISVDENKSAEY